MGFPIMVCEFSVGRASKKSVASSFKELAPPNTRWHRFGYFGMAGNYLLMMFYTVVAGWMMYYCYRMATGEMTQSGITTELIKDKYYDMLDNPYILVGWMIVVVVLSFGICSLGVQKGIEKITKIMMTCLLLLIVVLVINSLRMDGAEAGIEFYLKPDFDKIKEIGVGNVVFAAMSQAFFTLSIGMGSMAIFGSYLDKSRTLSGETLSISVLDTFVALMSGLIVIPACFAFNIQPLGAGTGIMDLEDFLVSNNILPLGSLVYLMFCTTKRGWGWNNFTKEADEGEGIKFPKFIRLYMTYALPVIIIVIYLKGYYDLFSGQSRAMFIGWMIVAFLLLALIFWFTIPKKRGKISENFISTHE